jgi:APA family basic amino acid/polyamine antiporter
MQESSKFNYIFTVSKLFILLFIIIVSFVYFDISNYSPFFNEKEGYQGIIKGATLVYYGYLGFDIMTIVAEESKNPVKEVPKAIVHSILYVAAIYILVSFSING